jgi:hypothetical protein
MREKGKRKNKREKGKKGERERETKGQWIRKAAAAADC